MQNNNLTILRKFVKEYGSILGLCWVAVFACYVAGFRTQNSIYMMLGLIGIPALLVIEILLVIRLKKRSVQLELQLSPTITWLNSLSMFMYACLLSGCMEYIYFAYMDKGMLIDSIQSMINGSELKTVYLQMGMTEYYRQISALVEELHTLSAFDKTMILFNQNFFTALILSIPLAAVSYFYKPATLK